MKISRGISKKSSSKTKMVKYDFYLYSYNYFETDNDKIKIVDKIFEWGFDSDADDFLELLQDEIRKEENPLEVFKLDYKPSIFLFMVSLNPVSVTKPSFLKDFRDIVVGTYNLRRRIALYKQYLTIIKNSTIILIKLYNSHLISLTKFFELTHQHPPSSIILFRGFNYDRYKELLVDVDEQIETHRENIIIKSVLSSSISEEIAHRFLGRDQIKVIWKINVPNSKFSEFKYSFVKRSGGIQSYPINYASLKSANYEYELLLNFGLILSYKTKKVENEILIYEFDFVGYDTSKELLTEFDTNIHEFINDLLLRIE